MNEVSTLSELPMKSADRAAAPAAVHAADIEPFGGLGLLITLCGGLWLVIALTVGSVL